MYLAALTFVCVLLKTVLCNAALNFNVRCCHRLNCLWITTETDWHHQPGVRLVDAEGGGWGGFGVGINRILQLFCEKKPSKRRDGDGTPVRSTHPSEMHHNLLAHCSVLEDQKREWFEAWVLNPGWNGCLQQASGRLWNEAAEVLQNNPAFLLLRRLIYCI